MNRMFLKLLCCFSTAVLIGCTAGTHRNNETFNTLSQNNLQLYLPADRSSADHSIQSYFKSNRIMVAQITKPAEERGKFWVKYPSVNYGPGPIYSHQIKITTPAKFPVSVETIIKNKQYAVFKQAGQQFSWVLIGYLEPSTLGEPFNWFSDKPELLFKN